MYLFGFVLILIFAAYSSYEDDKTDFIKIDVNVERIPPNNLQFQFQKNGEIETIALQEDNKVFFVLESDDAKYFLDPEPVKSKENYDIILTLKYHYSGDEKIQELKFGYTVKDNPKDTIIIRFPPQPPLPQIKTCTLGKCDEIDTNVPDQWFKEQIDAPHRALKESENVDFIDERTLEEACENDCGYAEELLDTALQYSTLQTNLLLKGLENNLGNPVDVIRTVIFEALELPHLEYEILQAKYLDRGLLFEMKTTKDVIEILRKAQNNLKQKELKIELTNKNVFYRDKSEKSLVQF